MSWLIRLSGNNDSLELLAKRYSGSDLALEVREGDYWLRSDSLASDLPSQEVYEKGESLIVFLNAVLSLYTRRTGEIESQGYCQLDESGNIEEKFKAIYGPSVIPVRLVTLNDSLPEENILELYNNHPNVRYVLAALNQKRLDWFPLYSVYETIASDSEVLEHFRVFDQALKAWGKSSEKGRFLGTAGWYRHSKFGNSKGKVNRPPKTPMKLVEAENFVRGITVAWLSFKAAKA